MGDTKMSELNTEPVSPDSPSAKDEPQATEPQLGDAGKQAIDRMKAERDAARRDARAGAEAVKRLQEIEDAQKSTEQKAAENAAQVQRDLEAARSEALRYKAAATHRVSEGNFDLLGNGTEEEIAGRAKRLGVFEAAVAERDQLKAELEALRGAAPSPPRPVDQLKPGAAASVVDDSYPASWFPGSRTKST